MFLTQRQLPEKVFFLSWHKIDSSSAISDSFISVRLLLFRDADGKPRKLYFDSDTTHRRIRQGESDSSTKITKGHFQGGYEYWVRICDRMNHSYAMVIRS